jgi:hypothetical protein
MEHYWRTLPGPMWFSATAIYRSQVDRASDGSVFVEVGAWKGRSTAFMAVEIANSGKAIDFFAVDHWLGSDEAEHRNDPDVTSGRLFEVFRANIDLVKDFVWPLRGLSTEIASLFGDLSVDFIFLDAGHSYADVKADLTSWWPKLKTGGVMAGDDWCFEDENSGEHSVACAVSDFFAPRAISIAVQVGCPNPEWLQWRVEKR